MRIYIYIMITCDSFINTCIYIIQPLVTMLPCGDEVVVAMTVKHLIPEPLEGRIEGVQALPPDCLQRQNSPFSSVERVRSPASMASKTTKVDVACTDHRAAARRAS